MSDAPMLLRVEAQRKLGWVAALFNLFLPGAGYLYCGRWLLSLIAFAVWVAISVATQGVLWLPIALLLFVDGFRCVAAPPLVRAIFRLPAPGLRPVRKASNKEAVVTK